MAQKLEQNQAQVQTQQLSTSQVALSGLIALPLADLAERVQNEMMDNEALEEKGIDSGDDYEANGDDQLGSGSGEELNDALGDYLNDDETPVYLRERADAEREDREIPLTGGTSFYDDLLRQIGEHDLNDREREMMDYIIGSLDEDGFLRKDIDTLADELAIYHYIYTDRAELERLLGVLQTFEPRGIGARSLRECLLLQLEDPDRRTAYTDSAIQVLNRCFKEFTACRWDIIARRLSLDTETLERVRHELTHLNPRPGRQLGNDAAALSPTVTPDFYVAVGRDGLPEVSLNHGDVPELHVSPAFRDSIRQYAGRRNLNREQREAYIYARQKVEAAQVFINLIRRRSDTLLAVMQAIVNLQADFFINDDDETLLRPLTLREVAAKAGVDISTASRVTGSKYVQTDYGIYSLKSFFSSQFTTEGGEELSARQVRNALRDIVDSENKERPLADEALAAQLRERGLPVARRTVAKYREQMGILPARLRKR